MTTSGGGASASALDTRWEGHLTALCALQDAAQPLTAALGRWLRTQRRQAAAGSIRRDRRAALDRRVPGWDSADDPALRRWLVQAEDLINFVDLAGRMPGARRGPDEARMYRWLSRARTLSRHSKLSKNRVKVLDKGLPGWREAA
ncbi:hypothetical protein [Arthrobacter sp. A2-55]|uniref:hypothetical protein n=1 Tax=Arthrobacter sp. A2-55 TaxID=2897337 RepID=UPI0021CD5C85|nr:hypothetical protein [Arthrobacter sp. A2-55]MCU6479102.1 hypothetical protein [Arthrobacter sp. A2-55]